MSAPLPVIRIKAKASHHGAFLLLLATLLFIGNLLVSEFYWHEFRLVLIFIYLLCLVMVAIGLFKRTEPQYSFNISPEHLQYKHRYGLWTLTWAQIKNISAVKEVVGLAFIELPYIGIRIENIDLLAANISPRLANRLLHEQKTLLSFCYVNQLLSFDDVQLNFSPFVSSTGKVLKGPVAAFLHHCQMLQKGLGYHLYIPETSIDREINDFCVLLKQCQQSAASYTR